MFNLGPVEIAFVLGIILLLFGPDKIPQLAKNLGKATREYQSAMKGIGDSGKGIMNDFSENSAVTETKSKSEDDQIIENAKQLGIATEGKTPDQLIDEILRVTGEEID